VLGISATGDFSETDNCVSTTPLAPSASCTASVVFTPTAAGLRTGGLSIANSFNFTPTTLQLQGTGLGLIGTMT
jgi:hypothetical protein